MKKTAFLLLVFICIAFFDSCIKEILPNPDPKTMDDLVIKPTFDWKTTADYELTLQGPINRVIMITAADGSVYKKGLLVAGQPLKISMTLPGYVKTVNLKYNGLVVELALSSTSISYTFK